MPTLHIHFDESGDWNWHPRGSKYFIIAATWTLDPRPLALKLTTLRYNLIKQGLSIEGFHAAPDKQATRDAVTATMLSDNSWHFGAVVMEKRKVNPSLRPPQRFYPKVAGTLLKFILSGSRAASASHVLIYTDTLPMNTRAKCEGTLKAIRSVCTTRLPTGIGYHVFSHCHQSNPWIQATDYCCWSVQRKWERADTRTYDTLTPRMLASELVITARGDQHTYY